MSAAMEEVRKILRAFRLEAEIAHEAHLLSLSQERADCPEVVHDFQVIDGGTQLAILQLQTGGAPRQFQVTRAQAFQMAEQLLFETWENSFPDQKGE